MGNPFEESVNTEHGPDSPQALKDAMQSEVSGIFGEVQDLLDNLEGKDSAAAIVAREQLKRIHDNARRIEKMLQEIK